MGGGVKGRGCKDDHHCGRLRPTARGGTVATGTGMGRRVSWKWDGASNVGGWWWWRRGRSWQRTRGKDEPSNVPQQPPSPTKQYFVESTQNGGGNGTAAAKRGWEKRWPSCQAEEKEQCGFFARALQTSETQSWRRGAGSSKKKD